MTVLFGHPSGNPNSHQAALAYEEAGWLEAFCVPWMPTSRILRLFERTGLHTLADRLARRVFDPLRNATIIDDQVGEARRIVLKAMGRADESLAYEANDWLMRTMQRECRRPRVMAVHAYEDCSLGQFQEAKRLRKACIYDLPIGYHPAWLQIDQKLRARFSEWVPMGGLPEDRFVRPEQKAAEIALADCILAPSEFVADTLREFHPSANVQIARYGVDTGKWTRRIDHEGPLRFLFVGQCSMRKGVPLLIEAWTKANLRDSTLDLVGGWYLSESKRQNLPANVRWRGHLDQRRLKEVYANADVFVLPTFFEGRALVIGEALASGLPVITTRASGCMDLLGDDFARIVDTASSDNLVESLENFAEHRSSIGAMSALASSAALRSSWTDYRNAVRAATRPFL